MLNFTESVALISAVVALLSLLVTWLVFRAQASTVRASEAIRLHEIWWSAELDQARRTAWQVIADWEAGGELSQEVLRSYRSHGRGEATGYVDERVAISRIAFFFADLNAMLDAKLVPADLVSRLFGHAQFAWYQPFLMAVGSEVQSPAGSDRRSDGYRRSDCYRADSGSSIPGPRSRRRQPKSISLLRRCLRKWTVGSNPTLSALTKPAHAHSGGAGFSRPRTL